MKLFVLLELLAIAVALEYARLFTEQEVYMLPGGINPHLALRGLILLQENEESIEELVEHVGMRRHLVFAWSRLLRLVAKDRSEIKQRVIALSAANQALEARVLELEQQLATLTVATK